MADARPVRCCESAEPEVVEHPECAFWIARERWSVHCPACYCGCGECGAVYATGATREDAIAEWNDEQAELAQRRERMTR